MILHWEQLALYYGTELNKDRGRFERAHQTTYALLCCRLARGDDVLRASAGEHAEARLLETDLWQDDIPRALAARAELAGPVVVTLAINRSPCRACAGRLTEALLALHKAYPVGCDASRFVLAATGQYWGTGPGALTLMPDLKRLKEAGWELCVLQVGPQLSERGEELRQNLDKLGLRGILRLG
jgi:hypothetical protein